jgi:hypothetical protein
MQISSIGDLLASYKKRIALYDSKQDGIAHVISEAVGIPILSKHCQLERGILTIKGPMALKNELYMRKEHILETLRSNGYTDITELR